MEHIKQNKIVSLDKLTPHPRNYRSHPDSQVAKLVSSLARFGQGRSIVVQDGPQGYLIVAGHGIVEAARKLNLTELRADILPADWTAEQVDGYLVADNLHSQEAVDDQELLAALLQEQQGVGFNLASLGSSDDELQAMLEQLGDAYVGESERDDTEDELPETVETRAKLGDVWQLGRHVLGCGNSCDLDFVMRLLNGKIPDMVFTDPPYNCADEMSESLYANTGSQAMKKLSTSEWDKGFQIEAFLRVLDFIRPQNGTVYICTSHVLAPAIWRWMAEQQATHSQYIVWCKPNPMPSLAKRHFTWATELICYATFGKHVFNFPDEGHLLSWWDIPTNNANRLHPTQKPLDIPIKALSHSSNRGNIVFDGFLGSGSTLIACEKLDRCCIGVEISPQFCDVALSRWEQFTDQPAQLIERIEEGTHA